MLERLLRPQPITRFRPLGILLLGSAVLALGLGHRLPVPVLGWRTLGVLLVPLLAILPHLRSLPLALLVAVLAVGVGSRAGGDHCLVLLGAMLPLLAGLGSARNEAMALGVGAGASALLLQAVMLMAPSLSLAVACLAVGAVLLAAVLAAPATAPPGAQLRALAPLPVALPGTMRRTRLLQVLLQAVLVLLVATDLPSDAPWRTAGALLLWWATTGDTAVAVLALALTRASVQIDPTQTGPGTILVLVPCAWTWWRGAAGLPAQPAAAIAWMLLMALTTAEGHQMLLRIALGIIGAAATAALRHPCPALETGTPILRLGRAVAGMGAYWRWYLPCKWRFDPVFRLLQRDGRPWGEVLDAGCGPGLGALLARSRAGTTGYTGIDLDPEKLTVARRLLAGVGQPLDAHWHLLLGRLPAPQALPARFDTVLLLDVLHYWAPDAQRTLLAQLRAAARPGAELWLREALADAEGSTGVAGRGERLATRWGFNPPVDALRFWQDDGLAALLAQTGWSVRERLRAGGHNALWRCAAVAAVQRPHPALADASPASA